MLLGGPRDVVINCTQIYHINKDFIDQFSFLAWVETGRMRSCVGRC